MVLFLRVRNESDLVSLFVVCLLPYNVRPLCAAISLVPVTVSEMLNEYLLNDCMLGHTRKDKLNNTGLKIEELGSTVEEQLHSLLEI